MKNIKLRLLVAFLTFSAGLTVVAAVRFIHRVESSIVDRVYSGSENDISSIDVAASPFESNEVYSVILHAKFPSDSKGKLLVVVPETTGCSLYEDESTQKDFGPRGPFAVTVKDLMPEIDVDTASNYLAVNKLGGPLVVSVPDLNIAVVNPAELRDGLFYKKYPNFDGVISLSQVGFNERHDQALVYVAYTCGGLCGSGSYVLLARTNGRWLILRDEGLWVS